MIPFACNLSFAIFENPTIASLAGRIEELKNSREECRDILEKKDLSVPESKAYPASYAQRRLWFLDQIEGGSLAYIIPTTHSLKGPLNITALESAVNKIVRRHGTLRTHFIEKDGELFQAVRETMQVPLVIEDIEPGDEKSRHEMVLTSIAREKVTPFDLDRGPLFRVKLLRLNDTEYVMLTSFHHVISDGWSIGVYFQELSSLYRSYNSGNNSELEALPLQYTDYSSWQRDWLRDRRMDEQARFWTEYLKDLPVLDFPADCPRPEKLTYKGSRIQFRIREDLSRQLRQFNRSMALN